MHRRLCDLWKGNLDSHTHFHLSFLTFECKNPLKNFFPQAIVTERCFAHYMRFRRVFPEFHTALNAKVMHSQIIHHKIAERSTNTIKACWDGTHRDMAAKLPRSAQKMANYGTLCEKALLLAVLWPSGGSENYLFFLRNTMIVDSNLMSEWQPKPHSTPLQGTGARVSL